MPRKKKVCCSQQFVHTNNAGTVQVFTKNFTNGTSRGRVQDGALFHVAENEDLKISQLLIAYGADVKAMDPDKATPLHVAAKPEALSFTELLLQHGANPNIKDEHGNTHLIVATSPLRDKTGRLLLEAGINFVLGYGQRIALVEAAMNFVIEAVKLLV